MKIVFAGLANAGKTSIILTVDREMEKLEGLKPTQGVDTSTFYFLGIPFFRWDLGGQKKYLKRYVANAERYFAETSLLIYVIDVQDLADETVKETIGYFKEIHKAYKRLKEEPQVALFFHKYDPDLANKPDAAIERLESECRKTFPADDVHVFKTSVKEPEALRHKFVEAIKLVFTKARVVDHQLDELGAQFGARFLYVYDSRHIQIAQHIEEGVGFEAINRFNQESKPIVEELLSGKRQETVTKEFEPGWTTVAESFDADGENYVIAGVLPNGVALIEEALANFLTTCKENIRKTMAMFEK
ncbi:MAG: hypothetical protein Kow0069_07990 [Promethearchaeota archaeon]